jgi:hypothetical protein
LEKNKKFADTNEAIRKLETLPATIEDKSQKIDVLKQKIKKRAIERLDLLRQCKSKELQIPLKKGNLDGVSEDSNNRQSMSNSQMLAILKE